MAGKAPDSFSKRGPQEAAMLILWLVVVYATICVAAYFGNRLFMYFPDPTRVYFPDPTRVAPSQVGLNGVGEIEMPVAAGIVLIVWHAPATDSSESQLRRQIMKKAIAEFIGTFALVF